MPNNTEPSYDRVPYPRKSHPSAHIRRIEATATLFDMCPAPVTECRVLELGCAAGWNLIPQAYDFPESEFIGVDASQRQLVDGRAMIDSLGLDNIDLRAADILNIDESWGKFDYILCHGVYSWVPAEVQQQIMRICKENLAPEGVAYVSYNVLPGWNFRNTVRDMMLYHTASFKDPQEQLSQARAVLTFMADNCPQDTNYGNMLREELEMVQGAEDAYLFHDHLESDNHPIYFHEFCQRAETAGLQYLGDSNFSDMLPQHLPEEAQAALQNASLVKQEQYMDFLRNNSFRRTMLCHASQPLNRQLHANVLDRFHLMLDSHTQPDRLEFAINSTDRVRLTIDKRSLETASPASKAALHELVQRWPHAVTLEELCQAVERRLIEVGITEFARGEQLRAELAGGMMEAFSIGMLELFVHPPTYCESRNDRPEVSPLVRHQAEQGHNVTNAFHRNIRLGTAARELVYLLDGTRTCHQLADDLSNRLGPVEAQSPTSGNNHMATQVVIEGGRVTIEQIERVLSTLESSALLLEA